MKYTYSLIIPVYNEKEAIKYLLKELNHLEKDIEVIIINDGSTDGTEKILYNSKSHIILNNEKNLGKGAALIKGVSKATKENIIFIDSDLEISIKEIPNLINIYENNNIDALVGKRWTKNGSFLNINFLGNYLINTFFNILYKSSITDTLCCIKIIKKSSFEKLNIKSLGFGIESEIMAKLVALNYSIKEAKVNYKRRTKAQGKKLNYLDGFIILWTILKTKFLSKNN